MFQRSIPSKRSLAKTLRGELDCAVRLQTASIVVFCDMSVQTLHETISVNADSVHLDSIRRLVRSFCQENEIDPKLTCRLVLAVDEHAANVIEHSGMTPEDFLEISLDIREAEILVEIEDSGRPFNPVDAQSMFPKPAFARRGYGLYLIQAVTDVTNYQRTAEGTNVLSLVISIDNECNQRSGPLASERGGLG